jgi:CRP-like cAMP-binding protein
VPPRSVLLIKEGMAIHYRYLAGGGRQILTFLVPGDLCGGHAFLIKEIDHLIGTITPVRLAPISRENMMDLFLHRLVSRLLSGGVRSRSRPCCVSG